MKRLWKYSIIAIIAAILCVCIGGAAWLACTTSGARWLLAVISHYSELKISAGAVEGQLAGTLKLDRLDIALKVGHIRVDRTEMTSRPAAILEGELGIRSLFLKNITIVNDAPEQPPKLEWPRLSGLLFSYRAGIEKLVIEHLVYQSRSMKPLNVEKITASLDWKDVQLSARNIQAVAKDGILTGNAIAGFSEPYLEFNLSAIPEAPVKDMALFRFTGKFLPGKDQELIAGNLSISASRKAGDSKPLWAIALDAAMTGQGFPFRNIRLILPNNSGLVTGSGMLSFPDTEPFLDLRIETPGVDLAAITAAPANIAGMVEFHGTTNQYKGSGQLDIFYQNLPRLGLVSHYSGNREAITLAAIKGTLLDGEISGLLHIDWREGLLLNGKLAGRKLNCKAINKTLDGEINFDLAGKLSALPHKPLSGDVELLLKESRLAGHPLTGELRASFTSDDIRVRQLTVRGKDFTLSAGGAISDKLSFSIRASDVSAFLPDISGSLSSQGWIKKDHDEISGGASVRTSGWSIKDWKVSGADIKTSFNHKKDWSFETRADLSGISKHQIKCDKLILAFEGRVPSSSSAASRPEIQNQTVTLSGKAILPGSVSIYGKPVKLRLSELTVAADAKGVRAELKIDPLQGGSLRGSFVSSSPLQQAMPSDGRLNLTWKDLDLVFLTPFLPREAMLEGTITGHIDGQLLAGQRFTASGQTELSRSKIHWQEKRGDILIDLQQASINWLWRDESLSGNLAVILSDRGRLDGQFHLPLTAHLPVRVDEQAKLYASLSGQIVEKGALGMMFPGLIQESVGQMNIDLKWEGSFDAPELDGYVRLTKAQGYLPAAGITLKDTICEARLAKDVIMIDTFRAASGPGHIEGSATIRLKGYRISSFEGRLNGERFQTIYFPELQVLSSPKLTFSGTPEKISVHGEVLLPDIQIVRTQSRGPVEASPDVIREGRKPPAVQKLPFELDAHVKLVLGDSVRFADGGIDAQLGGSLDLTFQDIEKNRQLWRNPRAQGSVPNIRRESGYRPRTIVLRVHSGQPTFS